MKLLSAILLSLGLSVSVWAVDSKDIEIETFLSLGKFVGACGIMELQLQFQHSTDAQNGDEFIKRFWTGEAARLYMTLDEYAAKCDETAVTYANVIEAFAAK